MGQNWAFDIESMLVVVLQLQTESYYLWKKYYILFISLWNYNNYMSQGVAIVFTGRQHHSSFIVSELRRTALNIFPEAYDLFFQPHIFPAVFWHLLTSFLLTTIAIIVFHIQFIRPLSTEEKKHRLYTAKVCIWIGFLRLAQIQNQNITQKS